LYLFLTQNAVFHPIVCLNNHNAHRSHTKEVTDLESVRGKGVFPVPKETACTRMAREGLWCWNDPEGLVVCRDKELAGACVRELIALEFSANV